jgi:uncharacterized protein YjiS (DUF1127 family)
MSAHTANSDFTFKLPSLSYIDAKWEEPNLTVQPAAQSGGLAAWLSARVAAFQTWRRNNEAAAELASMSNHELMDIGLSRADLGRVFHAGLNKDLRARGLRV